MLVFGVDTWLIALASLKGDSSLNVPLPVKQVKIAIRIHTSPPLVNFAPEFSYSDRVRGTFSFRRIHLRLVTGEPKADLSISSASCEAERWCNQ